MEGPELTKNPFFNKVSDPVPVPVSELDRPVDTTSKTKPSNYKRTSKVAPHYKEEVVKIDDKLFKKVLFFSLFKAAVFSNFSDSNYDINNIKFKEIQDIGFLNDHKKEYLEITGFVETIIVFGNELMDIKFVKHKILPDISKRVSIDLSRSPNDVVDILMFDSIWDHKFTFIIQMPDKRVDLAYYDDIVADINNENVSSDKKCDSDICYDIIKLQDISKEIYITQQQHNTLSNYVELLEKLITRQIVIEIRDGELFADNIKIGFKQSIQNRVTNFCRRTFASAATIHTADANTKLYDTILSVYRHSIINTRYKLEIDNKTFCGGRNNKTRKRHRNKTTYKKMQKTHNIRKRKSNGTKRK